MTKPMTTEELFASSGGGAKLHFNKYSQVGDAVEGTVLHSAVQQARDFDTNDPKFYDDGNPMQQLVITLQTRLRDRSIEDDDGTRRVFLRWWGTDRANTIAAVQRAGDKFVRDGSWMKITFSGFGEAVGKKSPPKIYTVEYRQPPGDTEALMTKDTAREPATVTEMPRRQQPAEQQLPLAEAEPVAGDAISEAARVQAERRAQIQKVQKLHAAGMSIPEIEELITGLSRAAITAILEI